METTLKDKIITRISVLSEIKGALGSIHTNNKDLVKVYKAMIIIYNKDIELYREILNHIE